MSDGESVSRETAAALQALPHATVEKLSALADWTATHAAPIGLTNFATPHEVLAQGIAPAITLAALPLATPAPSWAELGPGSGVLGLALALMLPQAHVVLIDRRQRVIDYLDLTIARLRLPNASTLLLDPTRASTAHGCHTALFRALAKPSVALAMAARLAKHRICAFHSPTVTAYSDPPPGFALSATEETLTPNLVLAIYDRCPDVLPTQPGWPPL